MQSEPNTTPRAINFNKPAYVIFVLAGTYFMITHDFSQASIFWGLALVFDPFNINTPFPKRPFYQKVWLFAHLAITFTLFTIMLMGK